MAHSVKTPQGIRELLDEHLEFVNARQGIGCLIITRSRGLIAVSSSFNMDETDQMVILADEAIKQVREDADNDNQNQT